MASTFVWIDDSEQQRQRMQYALDIFTVRGTRDELGLAVIRDAFSDLLFPGTGALQTRAAYFLFVPWIYVALERERVRPAEIRRVARRRELDLIPVLLASDDSDGTIGKRAGELLKRLPSSVYWTGLGRLGIRRFPGSQDSYHRSLDTWYRRNREADRTDDGEVMGAPAPNWHGIPESPPEWPAVATLRLRAIDARYLREQIRANARDSLLARMDGRVNDGQNVAFPWHHAVATELSEADDSLSRALRRQLGHARRFSEAMYGAAILYNLIIAEQIPGAGDRVARYRQLMTEWHSDIDYQMKDLRGWDLTDFWMLMAEVGARVQPLARDFVISWIEYVRADDFQTATASEAARKLITVREKRLKGPLARIDNPDVQVRWDGDSGLGRMDFRWSNVQILLSDIANGLNGAGDAGAA